MYIGGEWFGIVNWESLLTFQRVAADLISGERIKGFWWIFIHEMILKKSSLGLLLGIFCQFSIYLLHWLITDVCFCSIALAYCSLRWLFFHAFYLIWISLLHSSEKFLYPAREAGYWSLIGCLYVRPSVCPYFHIRTINGVNINRFSPNSVCALILWRSG